jgi:hypothetical protein
VSAPLSVVANPADASLAGLPESGREGGAAVALGTAATDRPALVRWLDRAPRPGDPPAERLIAPSGEGLWRVAPWPAADALLELGPPPGERAIVTGEDADARRLIAERAAARGVEIEELDTLDAERLAEAACVILADPGHALPGRSFAVLAARRLLIVPRLSASFGLEEGLDHLEFIDPEEAVTLVEAYRRSPQAFARISAWGRVKAGPQRASVVYRRLADDLWLHGLGPAA